MNPTPTLGPRPANAVSRRAIWYWTLRAGLGWIVVLAIGASLILGGSSSIGPWALAVLTALALGHLLVMPRWRFAVHRWEVSDTMVLTQSGWFTQERRIAPASRIQTVDSERGPLEQLFRLANVTVTTASSAGPLQIRGLDRSIADTLVARLSMIAENESGDAT